MRARGLSPRAPFCPPFVTAPYCISVCPPLQTLQPCTPFYIHRSTAIHSSAMNVRSSPTAVYSSPDEYSLYCRACIFVLRRLNFCLVPPAVFDALGGKNLLVRTDFCNFAACFSGDTGITVRPRRGGSPLRAAYLTVKQPHTTFNFYIL